MSEAKVMVWYPCDECGGTGAVSNGAYKVPCPECDGYGFPLGDAPDYSSESDDPRLQDGYEPPEPHYDQEPTRTSHGRP